MYDKPTNNETNLIRDIFAHSINQTPKPKTQLDEGWMDALLKAAAKVGKAAEGGAAKAAKTAAKGVEKTPETIPGVKVGKTAKTELPGLADRTMPKAEAPVRTGEMSTGMKTGAAVAAGTMVVGSAVAPFMVGGEQKKQPVKLPSEGGPSLKGDQPSLFPQGTGMEQYKISPTSPSGYTDPNKKWMPSATPARKDPPMFTTPARKDPPMFPEDKPVVKSAPMTKIVKSAPAPAPAAKPAPVAPTAKPARSEEELTKIVPGSQMWGELSGEEQRKIAKHYASGKSSLSIRHREGKGFDQPGYAEGTGQYGDIVSALNKVQMQESYYNRLSSKLDEAIGIEQSAYGFDPKGGRKTYRLGKRFEQEPMVSWSGDSTEEAPDLEPESQERPHIDDVVAPHISTLIAAADKNQIDLGHGEAFDPRSKDHQKLLKASKDPAVHAASKKIGEIRSEYGIE